MKVEKKSELIGRGGFYRRPVDSIFCMKERKKNVLYRSTKKIHGIRRLLKSIKICKTD
jgi:hypothetical protein